MLRFTAFFATVWGRKRDCLGLFLRQLTFCNIMFEVVFLFFAFWVCTFEGSFCTFLSLFFHLFQFIFPPVSVYFCNCFSSFLQLFQFSVSTVSALFFNCFSFLFWLFLAGKKMSWFDFLTFLGEEMTRVRLKSRRDTVWEKKLNC